MSEDIDHGFYIDAVVRALRAAGLTVAEYEAMEDELRDAYIQLVPKIGPGAELETSAVLTWHEERGWQHGYTRSDRNEQGIQCLRDLMCDGRYLHTVALPTSVADAVLKLTHTAPEDVDEALSAYLPAEPESGFGGLDPRALAIRIVEGATEDIDFGGIGEQIEGWHPDEIAAMSEEDFDKLHRLVDKLASKAVVTVEIPDEVSS